MSYKNPIPSVNDEHVSKVYSMTFTFEEEVSLSEATRGINELIQENNGEIKKEWLKMGEKRKMRYALPQE